MKILVCADGSETSKKALEKTAEIGANLENAEITVIHVYQAAYATSAQPRGVGYVPNIEISPEYSKQLQRNGTDILEHAAKTFKKYNIQVTTVLKEGPPAPTIIDYAAEKKFDLIVVGNRGLSGISKVFLGSVSNGILHGTNACVLIVK
ncbi:MAG TPA: universal stress protein [Bacteroidales bacterium]|nr:universal stress protein [Bacteroidales bacterium]